MQTDLRSLMVADAALFALVGQRINWGGFPQGVASPAVTMFLISGGPDYHMSGASGLNFQRVQIDVRAVSPANNDSEGFDVAQPVAEAVKGALSGYSGTVGSTQFQGVFITSERNFSEKPQSEMIHRFQIDAEIWWRAAA